MTEIRSKLAQEERGELFQDVGREQITVGTGDPLELRHDSGVDFAVRMAKAESGRTA